MKTIQCMRASLRCVICLFVCVSGYAQPWKRTIQQFQHTTWGPKDDAPSPITALAQTPDGYLWLGGPDGLYRFDGVVFERYQPQSGGPFPAGAVSSLLALPNGDLWISFRSGGISPLRNRHATNYTTREAVAQDGRAAYPAMAPLDQYLISDEKSEIALARRAAPGSISDGAEVMVLGHEGYRYRRDEITEQQLAVRGWNRTRSAHRFGAQRSRTAIRSRQNWTRRPIVITREPPIVPVTEPKFAPLFGQPLLIVALVQDSVPTGRVVGIVVDLPEPL